MCVFNQFCKIFLAIFFLTINISVFAQTKKNSLGTSIYAGVYEYGDNIEKEPIGSVRIYPETDSTILFFIDVNRGAPSYNMGQLYGRLKVKNNTGVFYLNSADKKSCKFNCQFKEALLIISTIEDQDECGFGYGVFVDGVFKRKSRKIPAYFFDATGTKFYFKTTKPETWRVE